MEVCKFGGASVKDADGVRNVCNIVDSLEGPKVLVISAMGKMTNTLEGLVHSYFNGDHEQMEAQMQMVESYHRRIIDDLFGDDSSREVEPVLACLDTLKARLKQSPSLNFDFEYDQIVSFGELLSTLIVSAFLNRSGLRNRWIDIRKILKTDDLYRDANVDWSLTTKLMKEVFSFKEEAVYVTQGFLGGTMSNLTTTLGREGSDYTAAIIGYVLDVTGVSIWKDVPGVLNADPRYFEHPLKLDSLSYVEALELAYYGAKVIHPKTLKPLQNKRIPLFVKSFCDASLPGTTIQQEGPRILVPIFILKADQLFMTLSPRDFSFIAEENLSEIFGLFSRYRIKINLMQSSALNFSACVDSGEDVYRLMAVLKEKFLLRFNTEVELLTIRHYSSRAISEKTNGREIIDSQVSRKTARFVLRQKK